MSRRQSINFPIVASLALSFSLSIVQRWLPSGRLEGKEWVSRNPKRADRTAGSFKVNIATGRWGDFATGDGGGDLISLCAFLHGLDQAEAARRLAEMIGVDPYV